jgi:hypothetical protein
MFLTTFLVGAKRHRPVPRSSSGWGGTPLWGVRPQISGGPRRKDAAAKTIASTAYSISTAQLCLWNGCAQLMLCSGSCGTECKSWGSFPFSVLISSPHYPSSEAESSAGKVPPAALLGCRKCKKIKQPLQHRITSAKPPSRRTVA